MTHGALNLEIMSGDQQRAEHGAGHFITGISSDGSNYIHN
jgi:hypothetical protein